MTLLSFSAADARGLHLEVAPWYESSPPDSGFALQVGASYAEGDHQATLFPLVLSTIRRGPLQFAVSWSYVVVRTASEHVFGFGDPKVFSRLPLVALGDSLSRDASLYAEFIARIPTAQSKLFPFASGGQELELAGTLAIHRLANLHLGFGRIWAEPPSQADLGSSDVPRATHAWLRIEQRVGRVVLNARADALFFEIKDTARGIITTGLSHRTPGGFDVRLEIGFETSAERERVFDHRTTLRFATSLR